MNTRIKDLDEYGLGDKFQRWSANQREIVERIVNSDKKYFVLRAPTGSGKSLIGIVAGIETGKTYYFVHNIQLQYQVIRDFPFVVQVKGRANFKCMSSMIGETCDPGVLCGSGRGSECRNSSRCKYKVQKAIAQNSDFVVFNYAYFLAIINSNHSGFDNPDLMILDEAHIADSALSSYVDFDISRRVLDIHNIRFPNSNEYVVEWLKYLYDVTRNKIAAFKEAIVGVDNADKVSAINQDIKRLTTINVKAKFLIKNIDDNWIIEVFSDRYTDRVRFTPVWVDKFSSLLLGHASKYLLMSATISRMDMNLLGIEDDDIEFLDVPSTFDPCNMPIKYVPVTKINRNTDKNIIVRIVDNILSRHDGEKGVIHTVSYSMAKYILEHSNQSNRMIANSAENIHTDADMFGNRNVAIGEFMDSSYPSVLVSPSVETGISLDYGLGRFQVVCKVPFASLGDKVVIRRKDDYPLWYIADAVNRIVQATGRICRRDDDRGTTYIIDSNLTWILKRHRDMFPRWFIDSVKAGNRMLKGGN